MLKLILVFGSISTIVWFFLLPYMASPYIKNTDSPTRQTESNKSLPIRLASLFQHIWLHRAIRTYFYQIIYLLIFLYCWYIDRDPVTSFIWLTGGFMLSMTDLADYSLPSLILYPAHILLATAQIWYGFPIFTTNWLLLAPLYYYVKQDQLGDGDLLLLFGWSLWLSAKELFLLLFIASTLGLATFFVGKCCKKRLPLRLPFVPYLSIALWIIRYISQ
jgi:leader peptidase (prepilin peptidase) / N-methyltransferase